MSDLWRPSASLQHLQQRALMLAQIRYFFTEREVLEVETPLLARYSVTDPHMDVLQADNPLGESERYFLQSSPEYAMKRLLAADCGAIYQISKAFRRGEKGSRHNPEFTMLEWYRPGFDDGLLMNEVEALVAPLLSVASGFQRLTYRQIFQQQLAVDPHACDVAKLQTIAEQHIDLKMLSDNRDDWLNLLLAEVIEPTLGQDVPVFICDYPASQSALAKVAEDEFGMPVAKRFELYYRGVELANGYDELSNVDELQRRFRQDQKRREQLQRPARQIDQYLMAAMTSGLPDCAGVALGVDRLLMLAAAAKTIDEVISFPSDRA
ncbi:MAG: lysyl-tRNA synthetase class 2 [Oceanicoccus sp.]|jgi:lysyl-tRNA synthetase class 2